MTIVITDVRGFKEIFESNNFMVSTPDAMAKHIIQCDVYSSGVKVVSVKRPDAKKYAESVYTGEMYEQDLEELRKQKEAERQKALMPQPSEQPVEDKPKKAKKPAK